MEQKVLDVLNFHHLQTVDALIESFITPSLPVIAAPPKLWRVYFTVANKTFTLVEFIASHANVDLQNVMVGTSRNGFFVPNRNLLKEIFTFYTSVDRRSAVDGAFKIDMDGDVIAEKVWATSFPLKSSP